MISPITQMLDQTCDLLLKYGTPITRLEVTESEYVALKQQAAQSCMFAYSTPNTDMFSIGGIQIVIAPEAATNRAIEIYEDLTSQIVIFESR